MKKIFICLGLLILVIPELKSQTTTLEFSKVLLITSATQTVPTGYIWKIENILPVEKLADANADWKDDATVSKTSLDKIIIINNQNIIVHSSSSTTKVQKQITSTTSDIRSSNCGYGFASGILNGSIWLPEGTTLAASTGVYAISVLEFYVNP